MTELRWPEVDDEVLKQLPPVLRAFVRALGFGRACVFLQEQGGLRFTMPKHKQSHLGLMADELALLRITLKPHLSADNFVWLPKADKLLTHVRNQELLAQAGALSASQQARKYGLTMRQVQNIRVGNEPSIFNPNSIKRNLTWNHKELAAMKKLAFKAASTEKDSVYSDILHKLERATVRLSQHPAQDAQFDLF